MTRMIQYLCDPQPSVKGWHQIHWRSADDCAVIDPHQQRICSGHVDACLSFLADAGLRLMEMDARLLAMNRKG